jgi:D-arabinonate dehydratase/D-galactarolactone cycloisomerase
MKITGIETFCLAWRMPYAITYAKGEYRDREAVLVKVSTDDPDIVGWGESAMWGGPHAATVAVIENEIAPVVVGEDPRSPERIWDKVFHATYMHGRKGMVIACLSGIDIACWDIMGKAAGLPLWRLLGGYGRPIACYASSGYYRRDQNLDQFAAVVASARDQGFRGFKMKIGNIAQVSHHEDVPLRHTFDEDIARIRAAREAIGADRNLMVDANCALNPRVAMRYAEELEQLEVRWFEEPVEPENVAGCVELAGRTRVAIAGFETETTAKTFARLMDAGAIQIAQPDVVQVGGLTEMRKIAAYAGLRHLYVTGKNYSTSLGQAATLAMLYAVPNGDYFEWEFDPLPWRGDGFLKAPFFTLEDGMVGATETPGLGVDVDETKLTAWRIAP